MGKASTSESVLIETTTFYRTQVMFGQEIEAKVSIEPKNLIQPSKGQKFFGNKERKTSTTMGSKISGDKEIP